MVFGAYMRALRILLPPVISIPKSFGPVLWWEERMVKLGLLPLDMVCQVELPIPGEKSILDGVIIVRELPLSIVNPVRDLKLIGPSTSKAMCPPEIWISASSTESIDDIRMSCSRFPRNCTVEGSTVYVRLTTVQSVLPASIFDGVISHLWIFSLLVFIIMLVFGVYLCKSEMLSLIFGASLHTF